MEKSIAIIGAGIGGLTAAIALQKRGFKATIYERSGSLTYAGAGIVLGANALKALDFLAVGDNVRSDAYHTNHCTINAENGKEITSLHYDNGNDKLPSYTFIHRAELTKILQDALPPNTVQFGKKLNDFSQSSDGVKLYFADGTVEQVDYVIASDGIHSSIRKKLLPHKQLRYAGYTCWRGILENCPNHFEKKFTETWGAKGRIGLVPLSNNRIYWYALKNGQAGDPIFSKWTVQDLLFNFMNYHDPIPQVLEKTDQQTVLKHDIYDLDPLFQYVFGNILLLGDAAHATTPNMGQGACQAIEDALYLALTLKNEETIESAFMTYEQKRLHRTRKVVQDSWKLGKIAQMDIPLLVSIRNKMLNMTPKSFNTNKIKDLLEIDEEI